MNVLLLFLLSHHADVGDVGGRGVRLGQKGTMDQEDCADGLFKGLGAQNKTSTLLSPLHSLTQT
jgi:hypothetical protein